MVFAWMRLHPVANNPKPFPKSYFFTTQQMRIIVSARERNRAYNGRAAIEHLKLLPNRGPLQTTLLREIRYIDPFTSDLRDVLEEQNTESKFISSSPTSSKSLVSDSMICNTSLRLITESVAKYVGRRKTEAGIDTEIARRHYFLEQTFRSFEKTHTCRMASALLVAYKQQD
jgi:hypothetical protein